MTWLIFAVALLLFLKDTIEIYHSHSDIRTLSIWGLLTFPYVNASRGELQGNNKPYTESVHGEQFGSVAMVDTRSEIGSLTDINRKYSPSDIVPLRQRSETYILDDANYITLRIKMPSNCGIRSWRTYEAFIETAAVGIYLYATFVLTSTLFLNADIAMAFSTAATLCLSGVKILCILF